MLVLHKSMQRKGKKTKKDSLNGPDLNKRIERYLGDYNNEVVPDTIYRFKGLICPDRLFTFLEYSFGSYNLITAATTGNLLVAGNSPFDPDKTGAGGQPIGFSQWSAFYARYRVRRSRILINPVTSTVAYRLTCTPTTDTVAPATVELALTNSYSSNLTMNSSIQKYFIDTSMETAKIYGVTSIAQQSGFSAPTSSDPISLWYWRLRAQTYDGVTVSTSYVQILIIYEIEFYQRLNLS